MAMNSEWLRQDPRYVVVSPVKDEEQYIDFTLRSVSRQSVRPVLWLIVDDGSQDNTPAIVRQYVSHHPFIQLVSGPWTEKRKLACAEVRAFNWGSERVETWRYDFIVKLDCDISFDADYFERLFDQFRKDERLGIASGVYRESDRANTWKEISMPYYHAAGACKVIRKECFEQIGPFVPAPGWDTVDEVRAMARGWTTRHFRDLKMIHHKPEGSSIGVLKTGIMQGEASYRVDSSRLFFACKVLHRLAVSAAPLSALGLILGYSGAMIMRKRRLVTKREAQYYRRLLLGRMSEKARKTFVLTKTAGE
jgi:glycosyltransferase involved in cell wall biosynthesis